MKNKRIKVNEELTVSIDSRGRVLTGDGLELYASGLDKVVAAAKLVHEGKQPGTWPEATLSAGHGIYISDRGGRVRIGCQEIPYNLVLAVHRASLAARKANPNAAVPTVVQLESCEEYYITIVPGTGALLVCVDNGSDPDPEDKELWQPALSAAQLDQLVALSDAYAALYGKASKLIGEDGIHIINEHPIMLDCVGDDDVTISIPNGGLFFGCQKVSREMLAKIHKLSLAARTKSKKRKASRKNRS